MKKFFAATWMMWLLLFSSLEVCLAGAFHFPLTILIIFTIQTFGIALCYWWEEDRAQV